MYENISNEPKRDDFIDTLCLNSASTEGDISVAQSCPSYQKYAAKCSLENNLNLEP